MISTGRSRQRPAAPPDRRKIRRVSGVKPSSPSSRHLLRERRRGDRQPRGGARGGRDRVVHQDRHGQVRSRACTLLRSPAPVRPTSTTETRPYRGPAVSPGPHPPHGRRAAVSDPGDDRRRPVRRRRAGPRAARPAGRGHARRAARAWCTGVRSPVPVPRPRSWRPGPWTGPRRAAGAEVGERSRTAGTSVVDHRAVVEQQDRAGRAPAEADAQLGLLAAERPRSPTRPMPVAKPPAASNAVRRNDMLPPITLRTATRPPAGRGRCSRRPSRTPPGTRPAAGPIPGGHRRPPAAHGTARSCVPSAKLGAASRARRRRRRRGTRRSSPLRGRDAGVAARGQAARPALARPHPVAAGELPLEPRSSSAGLWSTTTSCLQRGAAMTGARTEAPRRGCPSQRSSV